MKSSLSKIVYNSTFLYFIFSTQHFYKYKIKCKKIPIPHIISINATIFAGIYRDQSNTRRPENRDLRTNSCSGKENKRGEGRERERESRVVDIDIGGTENRIYAVLVLRASLASNDEENWRPNCTDVDPRRRAYLVAVWGFLCTFKDQVVATAVQLREQYCLANFASQPPQGIDSNWLSASFLYFSFIKIVHPLIRVGKWRNKRGYWRN